MSQEGRQDRIGLEQAIPTIRKITQGSGETAYSIAVGDQVVHVTTVADEGAITLTLPSVAMAAGKIYSIMLITLGDDEVITIADNDDSVDWADITNMDAANDSVVLYSDGYKWHVLLNDIA